MTDSIRIPERVWQEMIDAVEARLAHGPLAKPIAFALYMKEDDRNQVLRCRELPLQLSRGVYPEGDFSYTWPGTRNAGFYVKKGSGEWFEGTWIFGDGLDLDADDTRWMGKEETPVRIKVDRDASGRHKWKAYRLSPVEIDVEQTCAP